MIPVTIFAYCYGRIFHTIRRQSKVATGRAGPVATTSREQNAGRIQQQTTEAASAGAGLSRTEINVLQTMITVIVVFVLSWGVPVLVSFIQLLRGVSTVYHHYRDENNEFIIR